MWGPELHCMFEMWRTRDLYNGRISSLFLYLKLPAMNPSTLLAVFAAFLGLFLPLEVFGNDDSLPLEVFGDDS